MDEGVLVRTSAQSADTLEHAPVHCVSYAYEWPFSLLQRAALLHLTLLERLVPAGFTLQDATPSNVMFDGVRPVFIDVTSIVRHTYGSPWHALRQFLETMANPLFLTAHRGVPYQQWLRGAGDAGLPSWQIARLFGWRDYAKPGVLAYVKLNAALERMATKRPTAAEQQVSGRTMGTDALLRMIAGLKTTIAKLRPKPGSQVWAEYTGAESYTAEENSRKREAVSAVFAATVRHTDVVWDVGCNRGDYSLVAAGRAKFVIALDEDPGVIDQLCRRCDASNVTNVLPLVIDFADSSPAQGWRGDERPRLLDRSRPDVVVALGVLHHLVVTKNLPMSQVLTELGRLAPRAIVEYIAPADPMVVQMQRHMPPNRNTVPSLREFETELSSCFAVDEATDLSPTRRLYTLTSREHAA